MRSITYHALDLVLNPWYRLVYRGRVHGLEHIPDRGGFILCSNHLSARDPLFLSTRIRSRWLRFMAKAELFRFKPLAFVLRRLGAFPVDRGHNDLAAVRTALKILSDGHCLGVFPQGTRSRDNTPTPMHSGVAMIALRSAAPVIPVFIDGPYRLFHRVDVFVGAPVDLSDYGRSVDRATLDDATERIANAIWSLRETPAP